MREFTLRLPLVFLHWQDLLARPYMREFRDWTRELRHMDRAGAKAEMECLNQEDRGHDYIARTFLPTKFRELGIVM